MFGLEMSNKKELYISGCKGILAYTDDRVTLDTDELEISIFGENISMLSYADGEMYINGKFLRIDFEQKGEVIKYARKDNIKKAG